MALAVQENMIEIENIHLLIDRFGRWPSFHDAEVVRARFEREGEDAPFLESDIYVFEMTQDVDAKGRYVLKNHTLVTFRFCDIELEYFNSWNTQNVLFALDISSQKTDGDEDENRRIHIEMPSSYGCEAKLSCSAVRIIKAENYFKDQPTRR